MNFKKRSSWISAQFFQPNCIYLILFCLAYLDLTILQVVAFLLIGVATYGKGSAVITSLPILGGIVASGVFLLFVAVLGLLATLKHHQILLFVYMIVLFTIFVIQFSCSCAAIGFDTDAEMKAIKKVRDL